MVLRNFKVLIIVFMMVPQMFADEGNNDQMSDFVVLGSIENNRPLLSGKQLKVVIAEVNITGIAIPFL